MRVISLCASNTELLFDLGALDLLVGCDRYSDSPRHLLEGVPRVGGDLDVDFQKVIELNPDLVLASLSVPGMEKVVERLCELKIPHVVYDPVCVEDIFSNLIDLGERLGRSKRAHELVEVSVKKIERLKELSKVFPLRRIIVEWWPRPVIVPFRQSWVNQVCQWVNLENPFADRPGRSGVVSEEEIATASPEYYAVSWCGVPRRNYRVILVQNRLRSLGIEPRVFPFWEGWIGRPSLRILRGARYLYELRKRVG